MVESRVRVVIDDRARLVGAALAASRWPAQEQGQQAHAVHPHAKQTRQFVAPFSHHPAVTDLNQFLAHGLAPEVLFTAVLRCAWPTLTPAEPLPPALEHPSWLPNLLDFYRETAVAALWGAHQELWQEASADLARIFEDGTLAQFLARLHRRPVEKTLAIMPNLAYPALQTLLAQTKEDLFLILPPPKAVGESPPWPYREDPGWVVAQVCRHLLDPLLAGALAGLDTDQRTLLAHAAVTLCLETVLDEFESQAYLLRHKKQTGLSRLPQVVARLRAYAYGSDETPSLAEVLAV